MEIFITADVLGVIAAFISLFFAFFLLTLKTKNKLSNIFMALFLILFAIDAGAFFIFKYIYRTHPGLGMLISSTVFLTFQSLYLYFLSVIYSDFKLEYKHLIHLIPFILNLIIFMPEYYLGSYDEKYEILNSAYDNSIELKFSYALMHIQSFVYIIASYIVIFKYKRLLLENYSNANLFNYRWLLSIISVLAIANVISVFKNLFLLLKITSAYFNVLTFTSLLALGLICYLVLKALQSPELFRSIDFNLQLVKNLISENIIINEEEEIESIVKLKKFMIDEEPYLDPSLNLYDLSKKLDVKTRDLSVLINHKLNKHFFDFINEYRIKKAMKLLQDPMKKEFTVLEILYEVGFNSKSSFNAAFKKYTNLTPTQYRRNIIE